MAASSKRKQQRTKNPTSRDKVRAYRERLRAQGLRPVQIWVPDTRSPKFVAEARRQCRLANKSPHAADDRAFAEAISLMKFE